MFIIDIGNRDWLSTFFSECCFLGAVKPSDVWSKFRIISFWILCSKIALAVCLFQVNVSSSYNAKFISFFAIVSRLFTQSNNFSFPLAHFVVRITLLLILVNFSGHLELNTPLPIAITVFWMIAPSLTQRLWRMVLILVTNSSLTIKGRTWRSWKFFWYLFFQSLIVSFLKLNFGYFFDAHFLASGLSYFHAW